ncbi:MAG: magnesium/cobalt transporter CorA [Acidimicrobiales bacterium]
MLEVTVFGVGHRVESIPPGAISDHVGRPDEVVWVDLVDVTEDELALITAEFDLHPLAVEDVRHRNQRPKIDLYPSHVFLVGYAHDDDPLDLPEVEVFVGPTWLVSVRSRNRHGRAFDTEPVRRRFIRGAGVEVTVGFLLYTLLDDMVDGYFDTVEAAEDRLTAIEANLFRSYSNGGDVSAGEQGAMAFDRALQGELLRIRRTLIALRRRVVPMREVVLVVLHREIPWVQDREILYFQDVLDHLLRVVDEVDTQRELLGNIVDAHLALVANRTNDVMKKTSGWGAILVVATLIAGIYGMNFHYMPELQWRYGYFVALGLMLASTVALYWYFRRKGWI